MACRVCRRYGKSASVLESDVPTRQAIAKGGSVSDGRDPCRFDRRGIFSSMDILGQILGRALVCFSARGLALIDQHAAHERVAFEKLRRQLNAGAVQKQSLLIPQPIELTAGELMPLEQELPTLERFGFLRTLWS